MSRRSTFLSALSGVVVGALLVGMVPAVAGVGDPLILGQNNNGGNKTTKATANVNDGPGFQFTNTAGGVRAAARINTGCSATGNAKFLCAPPFATDTRGLVKHFNADYVDGLDSTELTPILDVATDPGSDQTTSTSFSDIPGMSVNVTVPAGQTRRALITFSSDMNCRQNPAVHVFCWARVVIDGSTTMVDPSGCCIINSVEHGANNSDPDAWGTHSAQWISNPLGPGTHTIKVQYRVDEADSIFAVDNRTLSVLSIPASNVDATAASTAADANNLK